MKPFLAILFLALAACATAVSSVSKDHVSIRYDLILDTDEKLQALADEQCATFKRGALFQRKTKGEGIGLGYAHFACVE